MKNSTGNHAQNQTSEPTTDDELLAFDGAPDSGSDEAPDSVDEVDGPDNLDDRLDESLRTALVNRGYTTLTQVQRAVLDADFRDHDLRISSQTGSGKTVAIGFVLHPSIMADQEDRQEGEEAVRQVRAIALVPTRELAAQVAKELSWLFAEDKLRVLCVTGGTSVGGELRSLRRGADVIVGTPGRLLDHLKRGAIDARSVRAVVLDEADQMLDFGFRDELEGILATLPTDRRTHMASATFSREVLSLAERFQRNARAIEGTRLGQANEDITHLAHLCVTSQRGDIIINELLAAPDLTTLIFVRTRVDAMDLSTMLNTVGFMAAPLTGELDQRERTKTLDNFRNGSLRVLVATDVAARGLDVPDVGRVIHADPPGDFEAYTHRSGRTGRAGKKGTSIVLVPVAARDHVDRMLRRARVQVAWVPATGPDDVRTSEDARLLESMRSVEPPNERSMALADALMEEHDARTLIARLLSRHGVMGITAPRTITKIEPSRMQPRSTGSMGGRYDRNDRNDRGGPRRFDREQPREGRGHMPGYAPRSPEVRYERRPDGRGDAGMDAGNRRESPRGEMRPEGRNDVRGDVRFDPHGGPAGFDPNPPGPRPRGVEVSAARAKAAGFSPFYVNWGFEKGADPRRLLALVCRRGGVRGGDVGAIDIGPTGARFEIALDRADDFLRSAQRPDAREPWIRIDRFMGRAPERGADRGDRGPERPRDGGTGGMGAMGAMGGTERPMRRKV